MKAPKEVQLERERIAWEMRQRFCTEQEIAERLGIQQPAVSKILKRLSLRFRDELTDEVLRIKSEQVAQLWMIAREAWQAWERSKEMAKSLQKRTREILRGKEPPERQPWDQPSDVFEVTPKAPAKEEKPSTVKLEDVLLKSEQMIGDPRYLATAMKALEQIRKITGADAPEPLPWAEIDRMIKQDLAKLKGMGLDLEEFESDYQC